MSNPDDALLWTAKLPAPRQPKPGDQVCMSLSTKVIRLVLALSVVVGSVAPTNAQATGNVREVEMTVRQCYDAHKLIVIRLSSGQILRGPVEGIQDEGFDLFDSVTHNIRYVLYADVSSASSPINRKWIGVAVGVGVGVVVWVLFHECFYGC